MYESSVVSNANLGKANRLKYYYFLRVSVSASVFVCVCLWFQIIFTHVCLCNYPINVDGGRRSFLGSLSLSILPFKIGSFTEFGAYHFG